MKLLIIELNIAPPRQARWGGHGEFVLRAALWWNHIRDRRQTTGRHSRRVVHRVTHIRSERHGHRNAVALSTVLLLHVVRMGVVWSNRVHELIATKRRSTRTTISHWS